MFDLEEYKEEIIAYYRWERDNTEEERIRRRKMLSIRYSDEYLLNIIRNTEEFIYYLIDKMEQENKIFENVIYDYLKLEDERATDILNDLDLFLGGGWPSDTFFYLEKGKLISMSLLHKFFPNFHFECICEEKDIFNEEEQAGHIEESYFFHISGPINKFNELKEKARNIKGEELINILKRIRSNKAN